jgi:hypothetical protein
VGPPFDLARSQRQQRLGAIQRLNLQLLIDTEHEGFVRGVQVQPDDVADFVDEERVLRQLERFDPMGLEREGAPRCG